ncbi:hypothetical protein [Winogradskyella eximia]|uniref:hypothetical protein n=1 Tax=Winogradskyella eximia TaxID=262006 RepID=UPI00248FB8EC|nr:hypothetical protein [Winogradskyella eximia]
MKKLSILTLLLATLMFSACSSDDSSSESDVNNDDYLYFISGKINGEPFVYGQKETATTLDYSLLFSGNSITTTCAYYPDNGGLNYAIGVYPNFDNEARPNMSFDFIRMYLCGSEDSAAQMFNDAFPISSYDYAISDNVVNGSTGDVSVSYSPDSTVEEWYSTLGGDQSGSNFEITSSTNTNVIFGAQTIEISQLLEGNFSLKLYNTENPTDVIEITEGQFKLPMTFD